MKFLYLSSEPIDFVYPSQVERFLEHLQQNEYLFGTTALDWRTGSIGLMSGKVRKEGVT